MEIIAENCERLTSNEYANYVVQHIISTPNLEKYRDDIIQDCLLYVFWGKGATTFDEQAFRDCGDAFDWRVVLWWVNFRRNLLSFSQEKFASHVVEKALIFAPPPLLYLMLEELFDGYLPDPQTKKDCLDILLFHQYGNYVVQRMLLICIELIQKAEK